MRKNLGKLFNKKPNPDSADNKTTDSPEYGVSLNSLDLTQFKEGDVLEITTINSTYKFTVIKINNTAPIFQFSRKGKQHEDRIFSIDDLGETKKKA